MIHITRRERFNAAHRLFREEWSDEQNLEVFGKCSNPKWHGHNYELFVTVKGEIDPETGFLLNLKDLSLLIRERVIEKVDHRNLNLEVDFMKGRLVSSENIAAAIWDELAEGVRKLGAELHCVRLVETENNSVEFYGYNS
ncbi:MAG: 6-carboxytetrahydropterin synthase [Bacteroidales bacterium]|nr:6-carboxytetrahydropterin synthase [Bacteroidales bacterium]